MLYSTVDGHTLKICKKIQNELEDKGCVVDLFDIAVFNENTLDYSVLIIGARMRYGMRGSNVTKFIQKNTNA